MEVYMRTGSLAELEKYQNESANWIVIAGFVRDVIRTGAWAGEFQSPTEWLREASTVTGYTVATLRRLTKIRDFLDLIMGEEAAAKAQNENVPVASLEVLKRMYDLSPDRARELFNTILKRGITYRQLRVEYDEQVMKQLSSTNAAKLGLRLAKIVNEYAFQAVQSQIEMFSGGGDKSLLRDYKSRYLFSDAIVVGHVGRAVKFVDGFEFQMSKSGNVPFQKRFLAHVCFQAGFFRMFWIVVPYEPESNIAKNLCEDLQKLGRYSIGLVTISEGWDYSEGCNPFNILLAPSEPPNPDWQSLFISELPMNLIEE